jgi:hypothetical protein
MWPAKERRTTDADSSAINTQSTDADAVAVCDESVPDTNFVFIDGKPAYPEPSPPV